MNPSRDSYRRFWTREEVAPISSCRVVYSQQTKSAREDCCTREKRKEKMSSGRDGEVDFGRLCNKVMVIISLACLKGLYRQPQQSQKMSRYQRQADHSRVTQGSCMEKHISKTPCTSRMLSCLYSRRAYFIREVPADFCARQEGPSMPHLGCCS